VKASKAILAAFLMLLAALPAHGQEEFNVTLRGEPVDCVSALAGSGTYAAGSAVIVEARPSLNCKFVKWIAKGLPYNEADSNPLIFQIGNDVELVAVFERIYETPGGTPIGRVLVYMKTNITGMPEKPPVTMMPGSEISVNFERELYLGDKKYVFLYLEVDGVVYDVPNTRVKAPTEGKLIVTAYYYTYLKFLDEYYPLSQFVSVDVEPVRQLSEGVRERAVGYRVGTTSFKLDQPIPRQLAGLVEPEYVREVRLRVYSKAGVDINGIRYEANPYAEVWVREGEQVVVAVPEKLERHRLQAINTDVLAVSGNTAFGPLRAPATVMVAYREIPNAFLLDIPVAGPFLLQISDLGVYLTGLEGLPALAAGMLVVFSPIMAAPAVAYVRRKGGGIRWGTRLVRGVREMSAVQAAVTASLPHSRPGEWEEGMRVRGRIHIHPTFKNTILELVETHTVAGNHDEEPAVVEDAGEVRREAEEALRRLDEGGNATLSPAHLAALDCDIVTYDILRKAIEEKRLKLQGGPGYLGYDAEGAAIERRLAAGEAVVVVKSADTRLGEIVATEACRRAGLSVKRASPHPIEDPRKAALQLRKQAGGAKALIHSHGDAMTEKLAVKTAPLAGIAQVIVSPNPALPATVELAEPSKERYVSIAAALAASRNMLPRLTHENLDYMAELAYSFRGVQTIEEALANLEKEPKGDAYEILRQAYRDEVAKAFTKQELELLMSHETVEELRSSFISYVRQTRPGSPVELEWSRFYGRLKRLGVVE